MAFEGLNAGDTINTEMLLKLAQSVAALLVAGPGIEIKRVNGDKIIISAVAQRGGTGSDDFYWADYTGP